MRVLLAGATGTLGRVLIPQLLSAGHDVVGIGRSRAGGDRVKALGAAPLTVDVMDREALLAATSGMAFDAVIHELTALKKPPLRHADMRPTNALRIDGTAHLIEVARETGATRFLTQSIVLGYGFGDLGTRRLDEDAPFAVPRGDAFDEHLAAMNSTERQTLTARGIDGVALRYGIFYGADMGTTAALLRRRMLPVVRHGGDIPFIHHADAAAATVAALVRGEPGGVYNIVDDTPATIRDLVMRIAEHYGTPRPRTVPRWFIRVRAPYTATLFEGVSMRVSNERAAVVLGWAPRYPSIREGISANSRDRRRPPR
ncbi:MAG TPA: NAD(P)-dependent oxidoreductase [Microbacterium sp.]|uniref:NAD-dependent epimerase/dehydratase family protein n=1 Tax=Microbacterium sp. TaxID=51671 RepID=UPI002C620B6C|nr:NAD(P)-dependent oxidoreductase [Microbacterium sp.]HWI32055.1 NAD(P)-dependent oxidoreductase [Microbacterium sp.]